MDKQFFFMAGLPRLGGTLLSSLLSQNPDVYVSLQSVLPNTFSADTIKKYSGLEFWK